MLFFTYILACLLNPWPKFDPFGQKVSVEVLYLLLVPQIANNVVFGLKMAKHIN